MKDASILQRSITPATANACFGVFLAASRRLPRSEKEWASTISIVAVLGHIAPCLVQPMILPALQNPWTKDPAIEFYEAFSVVMRNGQRWFSHHELFSAWLLLSKYRGNEPSILFLRQKLAEIIEEFRQAAENMKVL